MSSNNQGCLGGMVDRYISCGCGRNGKTEQFEIVNIEDIRPEFEVEMHAARVHVDEIGSNIEESREVSETSVNAPSVKKAKSVLDQYFERSLTNAASPKSWMNMERASEQWVYQGSQSGPSLNQASRKSNHAWQMLKSVFRRSTASEGTIISGPVYSLADEIEAYRNMWSYDSSKVYYYEDVKASGALLLDLPPEMLVNLKYREKPFNNRSAEEVVKSFLVKLLNEQAIEPLAKTAAPIAPEIISV